MCDTQQSRSFIMLAGFKSHTRSYYLHSRPTGRPKKV